MGSDWKSRLQILAIALALLSSVEPLVCPLISLFHSFGCCDAERASSPAPKPEEAMSGHDHHHGCHGSHESEAPTEEDHQEDCSHCHQHGLRLLVRSDSSVDLPAPMPMVHVQTFAVPPLDEALSCRDEGELLRSPPGSSGIGVASPLPLRI